MGVVVGYDGSPASDDALRLAVGEAQLRSAPLTVLVAWELPSMDLGMGAGSAYDPELPHALAEGAETSAQSAADMATSWQEDLVVSTAVVGDAPAAALIEAGRSADLLVVGSRGRGRFAGLLLGGVSRQVAAHASCPVMISRGRPQGHGAIVVGIDGSPQSARALDVAFEEASLRGCTLRVVHAWDVAVIGYDADYADYPAGGILDEVRDAETRLSAEVLAGHTQRYPDVEVDVSISRGGPADVVVEAGESADLIVVGSRGRGGFASLVLGSVSYRVIHHASCDVAVVH